MFQQMFAEMKHMLTDIAKELPGSQGARRQDLLGKYRMLRNLSDEALDEWLAFAEALSLFRQNIGVEEEQGDAQNVPDTGPTPEDPSEMENFVRGQGYYKLLMYPKCIEQFKVVLVRYPDHPAPRLYLAMSYLYLGDTAAAWEHLEHMLSVVQGRKLKAHIYNAMGCIAASGRRFDEARELFSLAMRYDPGFPEPERNLQVCTRGSGELEFGSQLVSLL